MTYGIKTNRLGIICWCSAEIGELTYPGTEVGNILNFNSLQTIIAGYDLPPSDHTCCANQDQRSDLSHSFPMIYHLLKRLDKPDLLGEQSVI